MKITDDLSDMPEWFQFLFSWLVGAIMLGWIALLVWLVGREAWFWSIIAGSALASLIVTANRN